MVDLFINQPVQQMTIRSSRSMNYYTIIVPLPFLIYQSLELLNSLIPSSAIPSLHIKLWLSPNLKSLSLSGKKALSTVYTADRVWQTEYTQHRLALVFRGEFKQDYVCSRRCRNQFFVQNL